MKRKSVIFLLIVLSCIACVFGLTACGDDKQSGSYDNGVTVTEVILSQNTLSLVTGESKTLTATVKSDGAAAVGWSSSDESVATVTNGTVTAVKEGTTVIVAVAGGKVATCIVTVRSQLEQALNGYVYSLKDGGYEITKVIDAHITEAIIPDIVTSIAFDAFRGCAELKKLVIPDSVNYIGYGAFDGCDNIEEVSCPASAILKIPKQNLKKVVLTSGETIEANSFYGCKMLTSVSIPNSVTSIGDRAFEDCSSLTSITIPDSVTSIGNNAFCNCSSLTSITIPDSVTSIGSQAFGSYSLLTFIIYCETTEKPNGWNNNWQYTVCPVVWNCKQNDKDENGYAYAYIDELRYSLKDGETSVIGYSENINSNLIVPEKVTYKNYQYKVSSLGQYAFHKCSKLISVNIPEGVTTIEESAFSGCTSLTSITIPDSVTDIGDSAFYDCSSLLNVTIGDGVTSMGDSAFYDCSSLTSITIPDGVTSIGEGAFKNCSSLTSITIPDGVTSIGDEAFYGCDKLIQTENGVNYIDKWVIDCDTSITEVSLRSDTKGIADFAFYNCSSLTSITIPDGVTSIGNCAFSFQSSLTTINYGGTKAQWNEIIKGTLWDDNTGNYTVYCKDGNIKK